MTKKLNWLIFHTLLLVLVGCSANDTIVEKEQKWKTKVEQFQPIGKSRTELLDWQNKSDVQLTSSPHEEVIILESIKGDGLVCSKWNIFLTFQVDSVEKVSGYSVTSAGTCL